MTGVWHRRSQPVGRRPTNVQALPARAFASRTSTVEPSGYARRCKCHPAG